MPKTRTNIVKEGNLAKQLNVDAGDRLGTLIDINPKKALKELQNSIKQYSDYISVPNRRSTDHSFRLFVKDTIIQINDRIKEIHALLIEKQQMSAWAIGERIINEIGIFSRDVEKGGFGFTTFFENPKLLEMDISQLYVIDYDVFDSLKNLQERTESFMQLVKLNYLEDVDLWFETLDRIIGKLIRLIDDRVKLIGSYERIAY